MTRRLPNPRPAGSRGLAPLLAEHPTAFAYLLGALERLVTPPIEVAIVGDPADPATRTLRAEVVTRLIPASVTLTAGETSAARSALLENRTAIDGKPTAYVCEHYACRAPVTSAAELREQIDSVLSSRRCLGGLFRWARSGAGRPSPSASASAIAQP